MSKTQEDALIINSAQMRIEKIDNQVKELTKERKEIKELIKVLTDYRSIINDRV